MVAKHRSYLYTTEAEIAAGKSQRQKTPRSALGILLLNPHRDAMVILSRQNATRLQHLVPIRTQRMSESAFAFYRGTAAVMAADLAYGPNTGIHVAACGDAHLANFGFYASAERNLVFDLNDFDEAAIAPWEWDLKRLATSVVLAARVANKSEEFIAQVVFRLVVAYARTLRTMAQLSPLERYFTSFDVFKTHEELPKESKKVLKKAIKQARKRTGERAVTKLTSKDEDGRLSFVETPPTMTKLEESTDYDVQGLLNLYLGTVSPDVAQLISQYQLVDAARRVVGVGSVGTRCALALLQDGDGRALIMQTKEATMSVLEEYGQIVQPRVMQSVVDELGHGGRVIAMQRVLQAKPDPFLGAIRTPNLDLYVRQFHDMKGGIDVEELDDEPFENYVLACAVTLARAHGQSALAARVSGYIGRGKKLARAISSFAFDYAALATRDHANFVASQGRES